MRERIGDAIQPSHPLLLPFPLALPIAQSFANMHTYTHKHIEMRFQKLDV